MSLGRNGHTYDLILIDINTQHDFFDDDGARPLVNAHPLKPAIKQVVAWARRHRVPMVSSLESRRPSDQKSNGQRAYCVDGTAGQRKIDFTLLKECARVEVDNTLDCPLDLLERNQQVIFRKRSEDLLSNPKADRLLTQVQTEEFVLFGAGLESAIKSIGLALLAREKRVAVLIDACGYWNRARADLSLRQLEAKGATVITISDLLQRQLSNATLPKNGRTRATSRSIERRKDGHDGGNGYTRVDEN